MYYYSNIKEAFIDNDKIITHLGGKFYALKEKHDTFITLGKFLGPPEEFNPTFEAITLNFKELEKLDELYGEMPQAVPELLNVQPCFQSDDHQAQYGFLLCHECNPFQDIYDY